MDMVKLVMVLRNAILVQHPLHGFHITFMALSNMQLRLVP